MLRPYKGLILSRLHYHLPILKTGRPQWECIESLHRAVLRFSLEVLSYTGNTVTLTEARDMHSEQRAEEMALHSLYRISQCAPPSSLCRLSVRTQSHIGCLAS